MGGLAGALARTDPGAPDLGTRGYLGALGEDADGAELRGTGVGPGEHVG